MARICFGKRLIFTTSSWNIQGENVFLLTYYFIRNGVKESSSRFVPGEAEGTKKYSEEDDNEDDDLKVVFKEFYGDISEISADIMVLGFGDTQFREVVIVDEEEEDDEGHDEVIFFLQKLYFVATESRRRSS